MNEGDLGNEVIEGYQIISNTLTMVKRLPQPQSSKRGCEIGGFYFQ